MPLPQRVLVIDDDVDVRNLTAHALEGAGYQASSSWEEHEIQRYLESGQDVVILDVDMPGKNGLTWLEEIKKKHPTVEVIMLSGDDQIDVVAQAMRLGAFWYVLKSNDLSQLIALVKQATEHHRLAQENRELREALDTAPLPLDFVCESAAMKKVVRQIERVSPLDSTVLLTGESGTGKSTIARLIHETSPRKSAPLAVVSCASLPRDLLEAELFGHEKGAFTGATQARPGRLEMADGGTLFLDEIGDLPLELQPKLLVFLQDRTVLRLGSNREKELDVRIIAATNLDLQEMVEDDRFREDLYFRLNVVNIAAPPLRKRREDLEALAKRYLGKIAKRHELQERRLSLEVLEAMLSYSWPGNIREMENLLERATIFASGPEITASDFPLASLPAVEPRSEECVEDAQLMTLEELERRAMTHTLKHTRGNKAAAARILGITEKSIYNKIRRLGLQEEVKRISTELS